MSDEAEKLRQQGLDVETVGEIIEQGSKPTAPATRFEPARLPETPALPAPGIYFGMSDDEYHALPALSSHGLKKLAASPMIFWAGTPWLSEKKRKAMADAEEKAHHIFGKAYHCRIMEGVSAFALRYAVGLDKADYPDCLESTDEIKAAIKALDEKPVSKVADTLPGTEAEYMRSAVKADWIEQLLSLDPSAQVFARIEAAHREANAGKVFLTAEQHDELEIAALMIERDPEVKNAFRGGYAEVVLIWYCPETGVPMKAKIDYLKIRAMVDLKSVANQRERSMEQAIRFEIANYHYNVQPAVYQEGAKVVRQLIRDEKANLWVAQDFPGEARLIVEWVMKWASHTAGDEWLWVFQQKGDAPITRGVFYPLAGTTHMVTRDIIRTMKAKFKRFSETFGTDPWIDVAPIYTIADEDIPRSSTEF